MPVFGPSTYAKMRANLTWTLAALLAAVEFVSLECLATPDQRAQVLSLFDQIQLTPVLLGFGAAAAILGGDLFAAYWLASSFKVQELWDTHVSHWRVDYDVNYILPELLRPFAGTVSDELTSAIRGQRDRAMTQLFYRFVRDKEPKIGKTLIVRFWEAIQSFWVCQLLELTLVLLTVEALVLLGVDQVKGAPWGFLVPWLVVVVALLPLNRLLIHKIVLPRVRAATQEEIDEIVFDHRSELERQLAILTEMLGVKSAALSPTGTRPAADRSRGPRGTKLDRH